MICSCCLVYEVYIVNLIYSQYHTVAPSLLFWLTEGYIVDSVRGRGNRYFPSQQPLGAPGLSGPFFSGKVKVYLCLIIQQLVCRRIGEWRYSCTTLYLSTGLKWAIRFTAWPLFLWGKSSGYPLYGRLGGPQSQSGMYTDWAMTAPESRNLKPICIGRIFSRK
jgi:hypothetical protein